MVYIRLPLPVDDSTTGANVLSQGVLEEQQGHAQQKEDRKVGDQEGAAPIFVAHIREPLK